MNRNIENKISIEEKLLNHYEKLRDHADKEIERMRSTYKMLLGALSTLLIFAFGIITFIFMRSTDDIEHKYQARIDEAILKLNTKTTSFIEQKEVEMKRAVSEQMSTPFILALVRDEAQNQLAKTTRTQINEAIEYKIQDQIKPLADNLDKIIYESHVNNAFNGSRASYFYLYTYAQSSSNPYYKEASKNIEMLFNRGKSYFYSTGNGTTLVFSGISLGNGVKNNDASKKQFLSNSQFEQKVSLINTTYDKDLFIDLLQRSKDLNITIFLCSKLYKEPEVIACDSLDLECFINRFKSIREK